MLHIIKLIVLILSLMVLILSSAGCRALQPSGVGDQANQVPTPTQKALVLPLNSEQKISGLVIENELGCVVDNLCLLRLQVADQTLIVVYHYGEWPPCSNEQASQRGMTFVKGDQVEAFGQVVSQGELSTCDSSTYYIRPLP